jgi:hypothetical protein
MKNLAKSLEGKTLADLQPVKKVPVSNLLEPTEDEINSILVALKEGKSHHEIKKEIRREDKGSKLGFSYGQIKEIELGMKNKIVELTPVVEIADIDGELVK